MQPIVDLLVGNAAEKTATVNTLVYTSVLPPLPLLPTLEAIAATMSNIHAA
jgi:hypothetical protein